MYDTVKLKQPLQMCNKGSVIKGIVNVFDNATRHTKEDGTKYYTGNVLGMKASVSEIGIGLTGSICKSYLGDNFKTLTRQDTQRAIQNLSDTLHLPLHEADVKRIDIANNFVMNEPPLSYYTFLGDCTHYLRLVNPQSIYYQNSLRTKLFYNKIAEGKSKGLTIPKAWQNKNILRYELRYTSRLNEALQMNQVKAYNLYDETFYIDMINRWHNEYETIYKNKRLKPIKSNMTSKEFFEYITAVAIEQAGQNHIIEIAEQNRHYLSNDREYYRMKNKLKNMKHLTEPSELITELNSKIKAVKEFYR
jgi:hypothetical protein